MLCGQLEVSKILTLEGVGLLSTIVQADTGPDSATYRILHIGTGGQLRLSGMTLRYGAGVDKGAGIPAPHSHASNQFMYCIEGKYEYTSTRVLLTPGSFYCNPKGNVHGPTIAHEETEPSFAHHPCATLPRITRPGITLDVNGGMLIH